MKMMPILLILSLWNISFADDFQKIATDLQKKKEEVQKEIEPILNEAQLIEKQNAELQSQLKDRDTKKNELLQKTEALKNNVKTRVSKAVLDEILTVGKLGNYCKLNIGSEPNEYYLVHSDGYAIRVIFAEEGNSKQAEMSIYSVNGNDYHRIVQTDFDPTNANNFSGPMYADIRLDSQKKIVHAVFRGETIKDKGLWGMMGSNHYRRGVTCITMEATDSI